MQGQNTGSDAERDKFFNVTVDVVVDMVVIGRGPAHTMTIEDARVQRVGGGLVKDTGIGGGRLEL